MECLRSQLAISNYFPCGQIDGRRGGEGEGVGGPGCGGFGCVSDRRSD